MAMNRPNIVLSDEENSPERDFFDIPISEDDQPLSESPISQSQQKHSNSLSNTRIRTTSRNDHFLSSPPK